MKNEFHGRRKRWGSFFGKPILALGLVFGLIITMPFLSNAAETVPSIASGSLTVKSNNSEELNKVGIDLVIDLYKVADVSIDGDNACSYTNSLGGISVDTDANSEGWHDLTQKFAGLILDPDSGKSKFGPNKSISLETMEEVDTGLYLLVARAGNAEDYVTVTAAGDIVTKASNGGYSYIFSPVLVSVPSRDSVSGALQYNVEVTLKAEQDNQLGSLKIVKTLQGNDVGIDPVTFVFDVEAEQNGNKVYSNVVTLVFDGPGQKELLVDKIPIGATVTVTEVYSGARCRLVSSAAQTTTIAADTVVSVAFTNEYNGSNGGKSITNHFKNEADGWKLDQLYNKSQG